MNVLVLCTGNSCRSQMAEGFLRYFGGHNMKVNSAGVETHGLNPRAVQVMSEIGLDISGHRSELVDDYLDKDFDIAVTVCDNAKESCPVFPGNVQRMHHSFPDPAKAEGTEEEIMSEFRKVRDMIKNWAKDFVQTNG